MLARAMNCLEKPSHRRPARFLRALLQLHSHRAWPQDLDARFAEAVEARENLRETDKKETRIFVQTHPDVLVIPPDPPQMMIKVDQVRHVIETIYYRPGEAPESVYIFTGSAFMKEAANSLLKVLEEPPEFATIFLLTENAGELLPTIRSRSMIFTLGALCVRRDSRSNSPSFVPIGTPSQRALVARLSEGAMGRALSFDLEGYIAARSHALVMLKSALGTGGPQRTVQDDRNLPAGRRRPPKDRQPASDALLAARRSDVPAIGHTATGPKHRHPRRAEENVREAADFAWLQRAAEGLGEVERGLRRNLLRSLSLDAFAAALERVS